MNEHPIGDFHVHTIFSGHAFSTLQEVISAARERGLAYLAITDHGPARTDGPKLDYFKNLNRQDTLRQLPGIRVLLGVEANITDTWGNLDMPEKLLHELDIVIAGFHNSTGYGGSSVSENTQALIKAIEKNRVTVIAHIGDPRFPYPVDLEESIAAAAEKGVLVEINQSALHTWKTANVAHYERVLELLVKYHAPILMNSDSHISYSVGIMTECERLLVAHGIDPSSTINYSEEQIKRYMLRPE
ncbi:MAG: PHP domain-containing protein [Candidatus Cryosericum sp.]|nr:PHP domain-containing protein [bacterium]